jgi:hypothetical protein
VPEQTIRFAVSSTDQRAATWKCWNFSNSSDVYLACRELGGALKVSLHESGTWRLAYLEDFFQESMPDKADDRLIMRWPKPPEIAPGYIIAVQIYTPRSSVNTPLENSSFEFIPAPSEGACVEISILLLTGKATQNSCPGHTRMGTRPIGSMRLPNGDAVSIVYRECQMPDVSFGPVNAHLFRGATTEGLKDANLRMLVFGDRADGCRFIVDSVGTFQRRWK